ncbi:MAG: HAMP domain-containing histidine kinase [Ignavibacteriaceae bacterium]|nr:HAMP domain-containing histidine kinase [Ignavibacteriaceae bacterium]
MKKKRSLWLLTTAFIFAQFAWLGLLGLWIYWYVSNYIIFEQVGTKLSPQIVINSPDVLIFSGGIVLIVAIAVVMSFIFRYFIVQMKMTNLYDNFIANVTHELKSPLASIQLYLETLISKNVDETRRKEFIALMLKDSNRLKKLIDTILEVSRLERKVISHHYNIYNAGAILPAVARNSMEHFRMPENSFTIECTAVSECVLDNAAMQIVFDNLTDNAIKYSPDNLQIKISIYEKSDKIFIEFSDKGIGISGKDLNRIFSRFERLSNPNNPSVRGTGLGLYLTREIIKSHGGKITVKSEGENKGTSFMIEIPVYKDQSGSYLNTLLKRSSKNEIRDDKDGRE